MSVGVDALPEMLARLKLTALRDRLDGWWTRRREATCRCVRRLRCCAGREDARHALHPREERRIQMGTSIAKFPHLTDAGRFRLCRPALAGRQAGARPGGVPLGGQRDALLIRGRWAWARRIWP